MLAWSLEERKLELLFTWKISRNASDFKINSFVKVGDARITGTGEAAPNIRYGETPELLRQQFNDFVAAGPESIHSVEDLSHFLSGLTICNSLRFAIESAYIHYYCASRNITVFDFLGIIRPGKMETSFSLPILEPGDIAPFLHEHRLLRFRQLKVKVNEQSALEAVRIISSHTEEPLMIDANEAWKDPEAFLSFASQLKPYRIRFIEQPLPAAETAAYRHLKKHCPYELIGDESVLREPDMAELKDQFHGINMKLMKAGGYLAGLRILKEARENGLKTMIGCMVETTLGISSAFSLCHQVDYVDLDSFLMVKNEPFGLLQEQNGWLGLPV